MSLSGLIHQERRAGTDGAALDGTDSILWIDAWFHIEWLGHGYFATATPVLKDIQALLVHHEPPHERQPPLTPVPTDFPQYWELRG